MEHQIKCFMENSSWQLVPLPAARMAIGTKRVFGLKTDGQDLAIRYNLRLVAKRFSRIEGVDHFDVFVPVTRYNMFRFLTALCVQNGWQCKV